MKTASILVALLILATPALARGQSAGPTVDVEVYVQIGTPCMPARRAWVSVPALGRSAPADSVGHAVLALPAGTHRLVVEAAGARRLERTVEIRAGRAPVVLIADLATSRIYPAMRPSSTTGRTR